MPGAPAKPTLICYDGSEQSARALASVTNLLAATDAVVLTAWQPLVARLAESGGFGVFGLEGEGDIDLQEQAAAQRAAEDGARRARESGYNATARTEEAPSGVWRTIIEVADEIDAGLIVCATRGRGSVTSALLGSTSRAVLAHAGRPVLISPEPRD